MHQKRLNKEEYAKLKVASQAALNSSIDLFTNCQFNVAWKLYKERSHIALAGPRFTHIPEYTGGDLKDKTIVVCYEQGLGEQILFAGMLPDLIKDSKKVIVECEPRLVSIFQRSFPEVTVVAWQLPYDERVYDADCWILAGDLGIYYRDSLDKFPIHKGYLKPDPKRVEELRARLDLSRPLIGLSWASSAQTTAKFKTVPFELLKPIVDGANCISLQYGAYTDTIPSISGLDLTRDIEGVLALISLCDYVVTISNTVAHLAGACGVKTAVLVTNTYGRLFYWTIQTNINPFYPSCRAVFQTVPGSWKEICEIVVNKVLTSFAK